MDKLENVVDVLCSLWPTTIVGANRLPHVLVLGEIIDEFLLQAKQAFWKFVPKLLLKEGFDRF